jgi:hypothetical protein
MDRKENEDVVVEELRVEHVVALLTDTATSLTKLASALATLGGATVLVVRPQGRNPWAGTACPPDDSRPIG